MHTLNQMLHAPDALDTLHHAYVVEGNPDDMCRRISAALAEAAYPISGNPDAVCTVYASLKIDDAHMLRRQAYEKPLIHAHRVFIIGAWVMTDEAQNALLKVLEEPGPATRFFISVPRRDMLIPAIQSRVTVCHVATEEVDIASASTHIPDADAFISATPAQRLAHVAPLLTQKDAGITRAFLHDVESAYARACAPGDAQRYQACDILWCAVSYFEGGSGSIKSIIEHIACTLPVVTSRG